MARLEHRLAEAPTLLRLDVTLLQKAELSLTKSYRKALLFMSDRDRAIQKITQLEQGLQRLEEALLQPAEEISY